MTVNRLKKLTIALIALPLLAIMLLNSASVRTGATAEETAEAQDAATVYKTKCTICHGAKAEKKFDPAIPEDQLVEIVLKGKKGEKPPYMPAYETKGVSPEQAKAFVTYMKELKGAAPVPVK
jgi:mono/diheme cytochrome c family protein